MKQNLGLFCTTILFISLVAAPSRAADEPGAVTSAVPLLTEARMINCMMDLESSPAIKIDRIIS